MIPQPIDQVPLFLRLSDDERELISGRMRHLEFNTHDLIFGANKPAEMLGVVTQGWVKLEGETPQGRVALANLGAGSLLGEVDVLLNRPYSTSARAASATSVLALYRQDLENLIMEQPTIGLKFSSGLGTRVAYLDQYLVTQRLSTVSILSALSEAELFAMANKLQFRSFQRGEAVFEAGEPCDAVYLIEGGAARLISESREGESFEELSEGDLFGQTALIMGKTYPSTTLAVTDLDVWMLSRGDFQELVREHPTVKLAFSRALAERLGADDQLRAVEELRALPLFADTNHDALRDIAARLVLRHFPAGELIYTEGTPGDAMYFVESGEVRLVSDAATEAELLDRKGERDSFGEMALLTGRTRAEAAKAMTDTTVWVLYKIDYDDLMVQHPTLSLALSRALSNKLGNTEGEFIERHLRQLALFAGLSQTEMRDVAEFVKPLRFRPGETICFAGQPAMAIYMIESGEVREIAGGPNGRAIVLDLLGAQQSFGERAVVTSVPYDVTVQAVGDVELWMVSKPDFDRLLAKLPALALRVTRRIADEVERANKRMARLHSTQTVRAAGTRPAAPRPAPPRPAARPTSAMAGLATQATIRQRSIARAQVAPTSMPVRAAFAPQLAATGLAVGASPMASAAEARTPARAVAQPPAVGVRTTPGKPWERASTSVTRPMPAATARPIALNRQIEINRQIETNTVGVPTRRPAPRATAPAQTGGGIGGWLAGLSAGGKIKIALVGLFVFWLLIMLPLLLAYSLLTSDVFSGFFSNNSGPTNELPLNGAGGTKQIGFQIGKIAARIKTATPTALPPTAVPTAVPARKPTARPVAKVVKPQPTSAPPLEQAVAPTESAPPPAEAAARPPLPPVEWDKRLGPGGLSLLQGVGINRASVSSSQTFWRLVKMKFEDAGAESGNDHTIYITLLDETGNRVDDQTIEVAWDESGALEVQRLGLADQKPPHDYCDCNYNWPMYGAGYRIKVDGPLPSDQAYGLIMPEHRHVNYRLTFQRVVMP